VNAPEDGRPDAPAAGDGVAVPSDVWDLTLYVAGQTPKSVAALTNLRRICEEYLEGRYQIHVVDLVKDPGLARAHQIVAIPTLVRGIPQPLRKIIGDLSATERVLVGLDVRRHDG